MKKDNGITLVALVVTIIILLIIAGVSIAILTGENGILNQATSAKNKTEAAEKEEIVKLIYNAAKTRFVAPTNDDKGKTLEDLLRDEANSSFNNYDVQIEYYNDSYNFTFNNSNTVISLDSSGNISQGDESLKLSSYFKGMVTPQESTTAGTITQTSDGFIANIENTGTTPDAKSMFTIQAWYDYVKCTSGTYEVSFKANSNKFRFIAFQATQDNHYSEKYLTPASGNIYENQRAVPANTDTKYSFEFNVPEGTNRMCLTFALGLFAADDPINTSNKIVVSDLLITKK